MHPSHLILGGARSGKSRHAQTLAESLSPRRTFIATAEPIDAEMEERIARHRSDRDASWTTVETPLDLAASLDRHRAPDRVCLVDCLTVWLGNLMHHGRDPREETRKLLDALERRAGPVVLVSNEVGLGLVPETPLGRDFRDAQGRLNQQVAARCERVEFVAAGLALRLKG